MLQITNTLTGDKEPFSPRAPGEVGLYVCGVTVYDDCHIGHARSAVVFDVIRKYLEYKGLSVRYVKNFTDVDDKIINRAREEGKDWKEIAEKYIASYERDMARLGVSPPTVAPKATDHIAEMIQIIEGLVAKGIAYPVEGDVYYEVAKFPSYGKLSKRKLDELMAGARVEVDERKKSPLDFALWKNSKPGEPVWKSPWGMGRPGWHIECSAMAMKHLGDTFDLHGGGKELIFPHHENEIAQSEAYTGKEFVRCWIHHGFVNVDQEKMSKSLGNFFTIREIFEKFRKLSPKASEKNIAEAIRYFLLSTHYRSPIEFSDQHLVMAQSALANFDTLLIKLEEIQSVQGKDRHEGDLERTSFHEEFESAMDDDFNTARAIGVLQELRAAANTRLMKGEEKKALQAKKLLEVFGEILFRIESPKTYDFYKQFNIGPADQEIIRSLIRQREEARRNKDWTGADKIRVQLLEMGITIEDRPDGTTRIRR